MRLKIIETVVLLLLVFGLHMPQIAYSGQPEESQLKAVFVLNFAKLTEWPADIHVDGSTFTIAILGKIPSVSFINMPFGETVLPPRRRTSKRSSRLPANFTGCITPVARSSISKMAARDRPRVRHRRCASGSLAATVDTTTIPLSPN